MGVSFFWFGLVFLGKGGGVSGYRAGLEPGELSGVPPILILLFVRVVPGRGGRRELPVEG